MISSDLVARLLTEILEEKEYLRLMYESLCTREIKRDDLRDTWDNFSVGNLSAILQNNISVDVPGVLRVFCSFGTPVKLIAYINGTGIYLNAAELLTAECAYVFDIPVNPFDSVNIAVWFDDSEISEITCKMLRLQEVR